MAEQLVLHDCPALLKDAIRDYWRRKTRRIERLLHPVPPDQQHLRLAVRWHNGRWDVRLVLMLPTGTLVADDVATLNEWRAAIDRAADKLAGEIRRHKERLRHDDLFRRKRRRQGDFAGAEAALTADRNREEKAAFTQLLRPLLRGMSDHAHRELVLAQLEGRIHPGELTVSDLLDEVAARAWERYHERPGDVPLEQWLVQLMHTILDEYEAVEAGVDDSLYEPLSPDDPRYNVDAGWVAENEPFFDQPGPLTLYETMPDDAVPEPWQEAAAEEQRRWILDQLRKLPSTMRRAFTLHVLDGWDEGDIAMVQRRSAAEVRRDIETVRQTLRRHLTATQEVA